LDNEAQALAEEYKRIVQTTSFNGVNIFNGSLGGGLRLQLGIGLAQSLNTSIGGAIGTGSFGGLTSYADGLTGPNGGVNGTAVGDLNGDGILDLVMAGYGVGGGNAFVRIGNGDGTFGATTSYGTELGGNSLAVALGDLNGDGILDIVTGGGVASAGQASILLGRGDGTFSARSTIATDVGPFGSSTFAVTLGDINNDGNLDLITAGWASHGGGAQGQASVRLGRGDGTFGSRTTFATDVGAPASTNQSRAVALGDIDGDGILDLITAGQANGQGQVSVRLGDGNGSFQNRATYASETGSSGSSAALALGDINQDGILDLITAGTANGQGQATIRLGVGDGTFQTRTTFATETGDASGASNSVTLGDVNGDGFLDLITAGVSTPSLSFNGPLGVTSVRLGAGNGSFAARQSYITQSGAAFVGVGSAGNSVVTGDLNGDGVLDIIASGRLENGWYPAGQTSILIGTTQDGLGAMLKFSLKTEADALQAMGMLDRSLVNISKQRGTIGASQTRVSVAISNLQSARENFSAAESRIRDADMAAEAATLTRTQILQQAGAAVLAQANQAPQLALRLLG
jgi:flagellin-like hook-associated protein FlgL